MSFYLDVYNIIPPTTKRITLAPTAPITASMFVSGWVASTKISVLNSEKRKISRRQIRNRTAILLPNLPKTKNPTILSNSENCGFINTNFCYFFKHSNTTDVKICLFSSNEGVLDIWIIKFEKWYLYHIKEITICIHSTHDK